MNVKKIKLRNDVLSYLVDNPSSEVKQIASHVGITKQALYYHLKILLKENKIQIVETSIVNGIEKRFYSVVAEEVENNLKIDSTGENEQKTGISDQITSEKHKDADEDSIAISEGAKEEESNEQPAVDTSTIFSEQDEKKTDHIVEDRIDSEENKYSRFKRILKSLTFKISDLRPKKSAPDDNKDSRSYKEDFKNLVDNIKSLGLFNFDSYDLMGSKTAFLTSEESLISFNNRKKSNFNVNSENDFNPTKKFKKNDRLIIIDESFIDSHERIISPLNKTRDQKTFISRFIQKKYGIKQDELAYTYEVFRSNEKDMNELNILFSHKKYFQRAENISSKFPNKDKFFLSIAGLITHYNSIVTSRKSLEVNMYIYFGLKGCEVTLVKGKQILFNRSILISNQILNTEEYLRETIPRIANTISYARNQLKNEQSLENEPENTFMFGPNASNELSNYFKDKFKLGVHLINVKASKNFKSFDSNQIYLNTAGIIKESVKKWGRFRYVFPQEIKSSLRKQGRINVINMFLVISSLVLIIGGIKTYENFSIQKSNQNQWISSYSTTLKLIQNLQSSIKDKENQIELNDFLEGVKNNNLKIFKTFSILNSDLFKTVSFENINLLASETEIRKIGKFEILILGDIIDQRPEAILEAQSIRDELNNRKDILAGEINFSNYSGGKLPVEIRLSL